MVYQKYQTGQRKESGAQNQGVQGLRIKGNYGGNDHFGA